MWAIEHLARYVAAFAAGEIPRQTYEMATSCVLDTVGAAAAGFDAPSPSAVRALALELSAGGSASVWFTGQGRHPSAAALANSAAASSLDVDDGHRAASGHPGAAIVPAVFAVAEATSASGRDTLAAIVLGYEIAVRVGAARDDSCPGWLSTGRWCAYCVAAAASWLRGIDEQRIAEAITIGAVHAPLLYPAGPVSRPNSVKEGIPWATFAGLTGVELAVNGFTGPLHFLDYSSDFDAERVLQTLGDGYAIEGVYFKPYACCRWIHGAIDAIASLMSEHRLTPRDISALRVFTVTPSMRLNNSADPETLEAAQFSFPFCLALAAIDGRDALTPLSPSLLGRPDLVELAGRVTVEVDPQFDAVFPAQCPARIVLETGHGTLERQVDAPFGEPANPMGMDDLVRKFGVLTGELWDPTTAARIISAIQRLESAPDVRGLTALLRQPISEEPR
jgi:2-methylcitrate dehydratase PrpD